MLLKNQYQTALLEAGCDEAGRGCLCGPVFAAAVILPKDFRNEMLNDSKKLTERQRLQLRTVIEREAVAWAVAEVSNEEIDRINILRASIEAMHRALDRLTVRPTSILVDGNRFAPYGGIRHGIPPCPYAAAPFRAVPGDGPRAVPRFNDGNPPAAAPAARPCCGRAHNPVPDRTDRRGG